MIIKIYPTGKFGQSINKLSKGDSVEFKGPIEKFPYKANEYEKIGMIAGVWITYNTGFGISTNASGY